MQKWLKISLLPAVAFLLYLYGRYDPASGTAFFPACPFRQLTHLKCPGCGSQRSLHCLLNGDIQQAFYFHPILPLAIPYLFLGLLLEYGPEKWRPERLRSLFYGRAAVFTVFSIVVTYWILRNLPFWPWE